MKYIFTTLLILILAGCEKRCEVDPFFNDTYKSMLSKIESSHIEQDGLNGNAVRAVFYLQELTGIKSKAVIGDLSYYPDRISYNQDMSAWKSWYKKNKCFISKQESMQVVEKIKKQTSWMD